MCNTNLSSELCVLQVFSKNNATFFAQRVLCYWEVSAYKSEVRTFIIFIVHISTVMMSRGYIREISRVKG